MLPARLLADHAQPQPHKTFYHRRCALDDSGQVAVRPTSGASS
jgi:hypothetical protein